MKASSRSVTGLKAPQVRNAHSKQGTRIDRVLQVDGALRSVPGAPFHVKWHDANSPRRTPVRCSAQAAFGISSGARERRDGNMTVADANGEGNACGPAYARFLPRLSALFIDAIVLSVVMFGALLVAVVIRSGNIARVLGFTVVGVWLLYEPLLVSFAGGTIGHRRTNLRVVDDRTGTNIGLLKSFGRTVIKGALGSVSFATMLTTRRSQAIHDLLTRSTVQVRDQAFAGPRLYIRERQEFAKDLLPSRTRRMLVIGLY